jgi:hypothetical protein
LHDFYSWRHCAVFNIYNANNNSGLFVSIIVVNQQLESHLHLHHKRRTK